MNICQKSVQMFCSSCRRNPSERHCAECGIYFCKKCMPRLPCISCLPKNGFMHRICDTCHQLDKAMSKCPVCCDYRSCQACQLSHKNLCKRCAHSDLKEPCVYCTVPCADCNTRIDKEIKPCHGKQRCKTCDNKHKLCKCGSNSITECFCEEHFCSSCGIIHTCIDPKCGAELRFCPKCFPICCRDYHCSSHTLRCQVCRRKNNHVQLRTFKCEKCTDPVTVKACCNHSEAECFPVIKLWQSQTKKIRCFHHRKKCRYHLTTYTEEEPCSECIALFPSTLNLSIIGIIRNY